MGRYCYSTVRTFTGDFSFHCKDIDGATEQTRFGVTDIAVSLGTSGKGLLMNEKKLRSASIARVQATDTNHLRRVPLA